MTSSPGLVPVLWIAVALFSPACLAHGAHVHGVAHVELVREGDSVQIQLTADGEGIVGFERAPRDAAEQAKVDAARSRLRQGLALFALPAAAGCRQVSSEAEVPHAGAAEGAGESDDHDHHHDDAKADGHADWEASYVFRCVSGAAADGVDLAGLFSAFPDITRAQLQWITDDAQSGAELAPGRSRTVLVVQ